MLALLLQLVHAFLYFSYADDDRNRQLLASQNYLNGNGWTLNYYQSENGGIEYKSLRGWPPGYAILATSIYLLTGDWFLSAEILDYLGIVLIFWGVYTCVSFLIEDPRKILGILGLFWCFSFTPWHYTAGADELTAGLFICGITPSLRFLGNPSRIGQGVLASCLWIFCSFSRYAYIPFLLIIPAILLLKYYPNRNNKLFQAFLIIAALNLTGIYTVVNYFPPATGEGNELLEKKENGILVENLAKFDAFPIKALGYMSITGMINKGVPEQYRPFAKVIFAFFSIGVLMLVGFGIYQHFQSIRAFKSKSWFLSQDLDLFWVLSGVFFFTIGILVWLSLKHIPEIHDELYTWTYVEETRYYVLVLIMIQVLLIWLASYSSDKIVRLMSIGLISITFCFAVLHKSYRYLAFFTDESTKESRLSPRNEKMQYIYDQVKSSLDGKDIKGIWIHKGKIYQHDEAYIAALAGAHMLHADSIDIRQLFAEESNLMTWYSFELGQLPENLFFNKGRDSLTVIYPKLQVVPSFRPVDLFEKEHPQDEVIIWNFGEK